MYDDFSYIIPKGDSITLQSPTTFLVDCGEGRQFSGKTNQQIKVTCRGNKLYDESNKPIDVDKLKCSSKRPDTLIKIKKTSKVCGNDGKIFQVGFNVKDGNGQHFRSLYDACFDTQGKSVFYVESKIYGEMSRKGETS